MESVAGLPKGFATGTADGTFISKEAPGMGNLKIRGTVIYLTEGPTTNWAAVFTSNKVRFIKDMSFYWCILNENKWTDTCVEIDWSSQYQNHASHFSDPFFDSSLSLTKSSQEHPLLLDVNVLPVVGRYMLL
jgi:hypothetical protein